MTLALSQLASTNPDDDACFAGQQRRHARPRLGQEVPVFFDAVVAAVIASTADGRLSSEKPQAQPLILSVIRRVEIGRRGDDVRYLPG